MTRNGPQWSDIGEKDVNPALDYLIGERNEDASRAHRRNAACSRFLFMFGIAVDDLSAFFGTEVHHAAFCELAWDRDQDVIYLIKTLRLREQTPLQHAEAVRPWKLQWAWPMDGRRRELAGAGIP